MSHLNPSPDSAAQDGRLAGASDDDTRTESVELDDVELERLADLVYELLRARIQQERTRSGVM
jgi:hypothetical protein